MSQKGFVYILTNLSMPNKVKVGKSIKVPTERAKELDTTGVPTPFEVQYYAFFDDMDEAEKKAHNRLSSFHHGKEFFDTDVPTAIHAIENTGIAFQKLFSKPEDDARAEELNKKHAIEEKTRREEAQRNRESIKKEELQRREENERKEISKTIHENKRMLIVSLVLFAIGIAAIFISLKYLEEGSLAFMMFFYGGIIICCHQGMKLFHKHRIYKVLSICSNCNASNSVLKISDYPNEKYKCINCQYLFNYSQKNDNSLNK